jgi:hypothetical protein
MRPRSQRNMRTNKSETSHLNHSRSFRARRTRLGIGASFLFAGFVIATWHSGNVSPSRAFNGAVSKQVVINQVYAGGGFNASSSYQNDFVELLNTSTASVDISGWSIQERSSNGSNSTWTIVNLCASTTPGTCVIPSGRYYLVKGQDSGNVAGRPALPAPNITDTNMTLSFSTGEVALVNSRTALTTGNPVPCTSIATVGAPAAIDFVGWGMSGGTCFEGTVAPNYDSSHALRRSDVTNPRDTDNNFNDFPVVTPPTPRNSATAPTTPTATNGVVSGRITDANGSAIAGAIVSLSGTQNRKFITDANGNYRFDDVETTGFYTVRPSRIDYAFSPAEKSFSQIGNQTEATFTGSAIDAAANPLDTPEYFVRQQYLDFLGREPDEAGFNFWSAQMLACAQDFGCLEPRRINVSAAYFLSIEFQETGGLVDALYRASYGRAPRYSEFLPDAANVGNGVIVGKADWLTRLAANKQAFIDVWVQRADFRSAFDALTDNQYVETLAGHTGVAFSESERASMVSGLTSGSLTRAGLLKQIAEDGRFVNAKHNEMFVMMEYFGYLRRDPDASGYQYWLDKLNQFDGNFERAEMVKAFLVSGEYRRRFQ